MTRGKHSEAQMIGALKQLEAGRTAADTCFPVYARIKPIFIVSARQEGRQHGQHQL
jgi:hypothetical protein